MVNFGFQSEQTIHSTGYPLFKNYNPVFDASGDLAEGSSIVLYSKLMVDHIQIFPDHYQLTPSGEEILKTNSTLIELGENTEDANSTPFRAFCTSFDQLTDRQKKVLCDVSEQPQANTFSGNAVNNKYIEQNYFFTIAAYIHFDTNGFVDSGAVTQLWTMINAPGVPFFAPDQVIHGCTFNELKYDISGLIALTSLFSDISNNLELSNNVIDFSDPDTFRRVIEHGLRNDLIKFVPVDTGTQIPGIHDDQGEDRYAFYGAPSNIKNVTGGGTYELRVSLIRENDKLVWKITKWFLMIASPRIEHNGRYRSPLNWVASQRAGENNWVNNVYNYPSDGWLAGSINAVFQFWAREEWPKI